MNFEILMITCGIYAKYHYKSCYYLYKLVRQLAMGANGSFFNIQPNFLSC